MGKKQLKLTIIAPWVAAAGWIKSELLTIESPNAEGGLQVTRDDRVARCGGLIPRPRLEANHKRAELLVVSGSSGVPSCQTIASVLPARCPGSAAYRLSLGPWVMPVLLLHAAAAENARL